MKKNIFRAVLLAVFLLSACGGNTTLPPFEAAQDKPTVAAGTLQSIPVMDTSITPSQIPTTTWTTHPTETPFPATLTITPLPTIPTFTSTFDARTIVTVTPASPAECPKENPTLVPDFNIPKENCRTGEECFPFQSAFQIQDFLNKGGTVASIIQRLNNYYSAIRSSFKTGDYAVYRDLTGDGIPDFLFRSFYSDSQFILYYCKEGAYQMIPFFSINVDTGGFPFFLERIQDLNKNGIPDIVLWSRGSLFIVEWKGETLKATGYIGDVGAIDYEFRENTDTGLTDLVMIRKNPGPLWNILEEIPWRQYTSVFRWNGQQFTEGELEFSQPEYRFQAVQDADHAILMNHFDKALSFYQAAIFSDKLDWWSAEKREYIIKNEISSHINISVTPAPTSPPPLPTPIFDNTEYPKLAAYSYYRIILLHIIRGYESDAGTVYNTLQQKFGTDPYGRPYVEMATAFWGAYQSAHSVYDGCAAAIHYADEHPAIMIPLGSDYHGWQSHIYVPADVCPFR